ncbi:MAG: hypothetical protein ACHP7N_03405 [Caulobacterales bacterium]
MRRAPRQTEACSLLLNFTLPRISPYMATAIIDRIHAAEGSSIPVGGKLLDFTVDLSAAAPHDCPPVGHFRFVVRDRVWLRRLDVSSGDEPEVGASIALFSTEPDEPLEGPPTRQVRVAIASILPESIWDEGRT